MTSQMEVGLNRILLTVSLFILCAAAPAAQANPSGQVDAETIIQTAYSNATSAALRQYCKTATGYACINYQQRVYTCGCLPKGSQAVIIYELISNYERQGVTPNDAVQMIGGGYHDADYLEIAELAAQTLKAHHPLDKTTFAFGILRTCLQGIGISMHGS